MCGQAGPKTGECAILEIHHKIPSPDEMDRHDERNLITLCQGCHSWHHKRPTRADVPVDISTADAANLLPHDFEIISVLHSNGPLTTSEVTERISPQMTTVGVRERLWRLMGLDNIVDRRDTQLIDQNAETGEWGMPEDIVNSARGRVPDDTQTLAQRIEDQQVRNAAERGYDHDEVAELFGCHQRTVYCKVSRARAYDLSIKSLKGTK